MKIEIANETSDIVHVAIYKRSPLRPEEPAVAWTILSPPPGGRAIFSIPRDYRVFVRYSFSPEDPWEPTYQTNALTLRRNNDSVSVREVSLGRSVLGAVLSLTGRKSDCGTFRIQNDFSVPVWCHVQLGERDVQLPHLLYPHEGFYETFNSHFFLTAVSPLVRAGATLEEHEIRAFELKAGKGEAFTIIGTPALGLQLSVGAPPIARAEQNETQALTRAERRKAPKSASAPNGRPKESRNTRRMHKSNSPGSKANMKRKKTVAKKKETPKKGINPKNSSARRSSTRKHTDTAED